MGTYGEASGSPGMSPAGSPTGGQVDGQELALRMIQAAESASLAARLAAEAIQKKGGQDDKAWFRVLPKPGNFEPKSREDELAMWRDFSWGLEQYLASLDASFTDDFKEIRENPDRPIDPSIQSDEERQRGSFLYALLASLVRQRPLSLIKQVKEANGLEAYRMLVQSLEPASKNRSLGLLTMILEWSQFDMKKGGILAQLLRLEEAFIEYERTGSRLEDSLKFAILMKCVSGQLKTWLQLNVAETQDYSRLREAIIQYDNATLRWSSTMMLGQDSGGPTPMEIDRIGQKGDKGKNKGKGKEAYSNSKGKGKGDGKNVKGKGKSQQKGQDYGQGKGQQKGNAKGDGNKGQKGKGDGGPVKTCYTCGKPGHLARDCWRVRQVADGSPHQQQQQSQGDASSTWTSSTSQATTAKTAAVKRIVEVDLVSQEFDEPLIFDLRGNVHGGQVRMIQFYHLDSEDFNEEVKQDLNIMMVSEGKGVQSDHRPCSIIVDSGADATVLPTSFLAAGVEIEEEGPVLQDAQGEKIAIEGYKSVCFVFEAENGKEIQVFEKAHFSSGITQPILSFGRLMESGWGISDHSLVYGVGKKEIRIPLRLQNKSLVAEGSVRAISAEPQTIRVLEAKLKQDLEEKIKYQVGWRKAEDRWIGVHLGKTFQSPQYVGDISSTTSWKRTTLAKVAGNWQLLEMCEDLHRILDQEEVIEGAVENVLVVTILTEEAMSVEEMGFEVEIGLDLEEQPIRVRDHEMAMEEAGELPVDEPQDERVEIEEEAVVQEAQLALGPGMPDHILVNGIQLTSVSPLRQLRAACNFFGVSQSGSRLKCYQRLVSHMKEMELKAAAEAVAAAQLQVARQPREQLGIKVPSQEEQDRHCLTHVPYQPWCASCLKHRGRPDRHLRTGASRLSGIPIISLDLCYTKAGEIDRNPQPRDRGQQEEEITIDLYEEDERKEAEELRIKELKPALWLIMVDSQTGALGSVPLKSKGQLSLMAREIMTFIQSLGHVEVGLYADNEPTMRSLLRIVLNSRHAMGLRTRLYTTKVRDSAGNSLAENAIQRVRGLTCTLMADVAERTGLAYNTNHTLWSWASRHACWLLNRYQATRGITSYELAHGRTYDGAIVPFGCPVYAYVRPQSGKGNPRWRMSIFLGKTDGQDAWIVGDGSQIMLTRSIRRVNRPWTGFLSYYQNFETASWEYQTNFGGRIIPTKRAITGIPLRTGNMPALESVFFKYKDEDAEEVKRYAQSKEGVAEHEKEIDEVRQEREIQDAVEGLPAPSAPQHDEPNTGMVTPPAPVEQSEGRGPGGDTPMVIPPLPWEENEQVPPEGRVLRKLPPPSSAVKIEPDSMRLRIDEPERESHSTSASRSAMIERRVEHVRVAGEDMYHLDEVVDVETLVIDEDQEDVEGLKHGVVPEELWSDHPLTNTPPQPAEEVDALARGVEERRLMRMDVIEKLTPQEADLDALTTRFVYDWRIKTYVEKSGTQRKRWLRRARLVARDYAHDKRDDVYSPASGQYALRLLPVLFLSAASMEKDFEHYKGKPVIGALDVKDAFLQVPQEKPLRITTAVGEYKVLRNLPGQRIGAKAWYEHLRSYLIEEQGFSFDIINPCLGKRGVGEDLVCVLIHVDDIMFTGKEEPVNNFIQSMEKRFDIEVNVMKNYGDEFSFLKRKYVYTPEGLSVKPGSYATNMVKTFEDHFGPVKRQRLPATADIQDYDGSSTIPQQDAAVYRSVVGMGIYLAQERCDIAFCIKELASKMSSPTEISIQKMRKFLGYLKDTENQSMMLPLPQRGEGMNMHSNHTWLLETYTDADWSGNKVTRRSTSSAVHTINGIVVHCSSRGQKVVSLSSAESELHALVSGACDGICLKHSLEFLTGDDVHHICWVDNSATRQIACKRGAGKLRHVSGKLLWCQSKVASGDLEVRQVGTARNLADIGTKPLSQQRLRLLLYWLQARDEDGGRVGQREFEQFSEQHIEKGKVMKIAKYLNRLVFVSGLELATGARVEPDLSEREGYGYIEKFIYLIMILAAIFLVWWLRRKFKELEQRIVILESELEVHKYSTRSSLDEQEKVWSMQMDYTQRIHRALIYRGGFVEDHSIRDGLEWETLHYIEKVNRRHEGLHLKVQWDVVNQRRQEQGESRIPNRFSPDDPGPPRDGGEDGPDEQGDDGRMLSGDTATIRLDDGNVVEVPVEYVEIAQEVAQAGGSPPEPEPSPGDEDEDMESTTTPEAPAGPPDAWQPEPIEIPEQKFNFFNRPYNRADLKARQELAKVEATWYHAMRANDQDLAGKMYRVMEECFSFMDPHPDETAFS